MAIILLMQRRLKYLRYEVRSEFRYFGVCTIAVSEKLNFYFIIDDRCADFFCSCDGIDFIFL